MAPAAGPGGRPDRLRAGAARGRLHLSLLPRDRGRLLPRRGHAGGPAPLARGGAVRLGFDEVRHGHGADRDRGAGPARGRLRPRDQAGRLGRRHHHLLRRRRHQPGRRQRGPRFCRQLPGPGAVLLPEQPLGHLRAGPGAGPRPAGRPGRRIRHPRGAGGRQRRPGLPCRDPARAGPGPLRQRPRLHRSGDLPHGPTYDGRRSHPLPRPQRTGPVEGQGPDRPRGGAPGLPRPRRGGAAGAAAAGRGRDGRPAAPGGGPDTGPRPAGPLRSRLRRPARTARTRAPRVRPVLGPV